MSWRGGAPKVPQHRFDLAVVDHYTPLITAALRRMFPEATIRAAVEQVAGTVVAKSTPAPSDPAEQGLLRSAARAALTAGSADELDQLLRGMFADAYAAGGHAATTQLGSLAVSSLAGVADMDWGSWVPGDPAAAALLANGGLARLLDAAGVTIRGVTDTTLEQLSDVIGDGLAAGSSVDQVTGDVMDVIDDPARAERIAQTETARAMTVATMDTYGANGIAEWQWVLSGGACPECEEQAERGPQPVGSAEAQPPLHPYCRCAVSPVDPGSSS